MPVDLKTAKAGRLRAKVRSSHSTSCAPCGAIPADEEGPSTSSKERHRVALRLQSWVDTTLPRQCLDGSENDGAFAEDNSGWFIGKHSAFALATLIAARAWKNELSVDQARLDESIRRALTFLTRRQHADGRLDLYGIYSSNEVGFTIPGLVEGYMRLLSIPELADLCPALKQYLLLGAEAVLQGSAHTANHRWAAVCGPLAVLNKLWPDPRYLRKIDSYLEDGIDCDADGCWYFERSPHYFSVANQGLLMIADNLGNSAFYEPIVRNLEFIIHTLQPNGEADTSFSHRQDRGSRNSPPCSYGVVRRMAQRTGDGRFAELAERIWKLGRLTDELIPLPFQIDRHDVNLPAPASLPDRYEKFFQGINIARIRESQTSLTLSSDADEHFFSSVRDQWGGPKRSDDWFHLHHGDTVIQSMHLAGVGMTNIQPETLVQESPRHYRLTGFMWGWLHPLHFRPRRPVVEMPFDWSHEISVHWDNSTFAITLKASSPHCLAAILRFWIRTPIIVEENKVSRPLNAGQEIWREGEGDVLLTGAKNALRISGLPRSQHRFPFRPTEPIPSRMQEHCGCLSIGLTFPVDLNFRILLENGSESQLSEQG